MPTLTTHIIPTDGGWTIRKEGVARRPTVYPTLNRALEVARVTVRRSRAGQIVVHLRDGSMRRYEVHGMPPLPPSSHKSDIGTKTIKRAISAVIRKRLMREA